MIAADQPHVIIATIMIATTLMTGCLSFHSGPMPGEPPAANYEDIDGVRVRWVEAGQGPPVVLVHGFGAALETWAAVIPKLAKHHRVVALDLKGFGWTDRPAGDYTPQAQAELVLAFMDARGIEAAPIVAHSYGTSVALAAALHAPERVTKLALYSAFVFPEEIPTGFVWSRADGIGELLFALFYDQQPFARVREGFYDDRYITMDLLDDVEEGLARPGTDAAALAVVRGLASFEHMAPRYPEVVQPTLLLWGEDDIVTPVAYGAKLMKTLPNARLVTFGQCGHFPMIEAAGPSVVELESFLHE